MESHSTKRKKIRDYLGLNYTVMLVPHSGKAPSKLRLPAGTIAAAFLTLFALLCCTTGFAVEAWKMQAVAAENTGLKKITAEQEQQLTDLEQLAQNLTDYAKAASEQTDEVRAAIGLEPSGLNVPDAKGGPFQPWLEGTHLGDGELNERFSRLSTTLYALDEYYVEYLSDTQELEQEVYDWEYSAGRIPDSWPLESYKMSSSFGVRVDPFTYELSTHSGLDLVAEYGTPIYAAGRGEVVIAKNGSAGYGNYIVIDHGNGYETLYAHCSKLEVSQGDQVEKGQLIALVGASGRASGSHLHYELRQDGQVINPLILLP